MTTKKILCIIGTRPEAIKMAPLILHLQTQPWASVYIVVTAQHRELLDQALSLFNLRPNLDLNIMTPHQTLSGLTANILQQLTPILKEQQPDIVLAQGDTTTTFASALASFYQQIPFGHIEAGLRSHQFNNPFPEEINRKLATQLTRLHFAPTQIASNNLLAEGIPAENIFVTGNTVVDALLLIMKMTTRAPPEFRLNPYHRLILVTTHRRENFGAPLIAICAALLALVHQLPDIEIILPVHPNPVVTQTIYTYLANNPAIHLIPPIPYDQMIGLLQHVTLVLTDSGGLQEEAPVFGKPVLILRDFTERPEGVLAGIAELVGTRTSTIIERTIKLLTDSVAYQKQSKTACPYGDGHAALYISEILQQQL